MRKRIRVKSILTSLLALVATSIPLQPSSVAQAGEPVPLVNFTTDHATAYEAIMAVAKQTRVPIGIVSGQPVNKLSIEKRAFNIESKDAETSLLEAIRSTGYSLKKEDNVFVLCAGNLTSRQHDLLTHHYENFPAAGPSSMVEWGWTLTMWIRSVTHPAQGFAASILGSPDDERLALRATRDATTEEIANQIVSLGSKGIWILRVAADASDDVSNDTIEIIPYEQFDRVAKN